MNNWTTNSISVCKKCKKEFEGCSTLCEHCKIVKKMFDCRIIAENRAELGIPILYREKNGYYCGGYANDGDEPADLCKECIIFLGNENISE